MYEGANKVGSGRAFGGSSLNQADAIRPQRSVERAIQEIRRALDRVAGITQAVRENADRHHGPEPMPPGVNKNDAAPAPVPSAEGWQLNDALAQLHARLDTLDEQVNRLATI